MRYFLDTEFHEGMVKPTFGRAYHRIDLISVGIVSEDHRQYYAINKEFDIKAAWYKWQPKKIPAGGGEYKEIFPMEKEYWLRENVLWPIYWALIQKDDPMQAHGLWSCRSNMFSYYEFKRMIKKYGKTKVEIAQEIFDFCRGGNFKLTNQHAETGHDGGPRVGDLSWRTNPEFWGYFADYDWVAICGSLFGSMMNLPLTFPMYCKDLKQLLDLYVQYKMSDLTFWKSFGCEDYPKDFDDALSTLKKYHPDYPKQKNEHTADNDAVWNLELHTFLTERVKR